MMKKLFFIIFSGVAAWAVSAGSAALPDPFFKFAERDFSLAEAQLIAPGRKDLQSLRSAITAKLPAAAAVTLCSRSGIRLSQEKTLQALLDSLLLMTDAERRLFSQKLTESGLTREKWLQQESARFENQLNEALRRWFRQLNNSRQVSEIQIRDYYYRNLHIFRRTRLNEHKVWVFDPDSNQTARQAFAELMQGAAPDAVRRKYARKLPSKQWIDDLQLHYSSRSSLNEKYLLVKGAQQLYLLEKDALKDFYLPLDERLATAIGNALYDALAKAYLAEVLKKDFSARDLVFY